MMMTQVDIKAVLFDFGGVITTSPFEAFARFERENGLPSDFIRRINATNPDTNAWARLERSEVGLEEFDALFAAEARAAGHELSGLTVLTLLDGDIRPEMVTALRLCRERFALGCITNNIVPHEKDLDRDATPKELEILEILGLFDHVVESSKIGIRKPDPRIYQLACDAMGVSPEQSVYLDDLGINLKPARALGMATIKVISAKQALDELQKILEIPLLD